MKILLICGSRTTTPAMLEKVAEVVRWAKNHDYHIICGDAPGIDHAVQLATCTGVIRPEILRIYGINDSPRYVCCAAHMNSYVQVIGDYLARDRVMVEHADRVIGICLDNSSGTLYTCEYAAKLGVPVGVVHYRSLRHE
jgi:predicted Rossmann fold nucleotide-binding protein DprA/Smf involved in DNA uptake